MYGLIQVLCICCNSCNSCNISSCGSVDWIKKLAFFWVFEIFVSIILSITLTSGWIAIIVCVISFLPPFIAFIKMKTANAKDLDLLFKIYVLFTIIIGILSLWEDYCSV